MATTIRGGSIKADGGEQNKQSRAYVTLLFKLSELLERDGVFFVDSDLAKLTSVNW